MGRASRKGALAWAQSVGDGLGRGLDPEMVRPVAALRFLEIETTQSCWGHNDSGLSYPWVDFPEPPPPEILKELPSFHLVPKGVHGACRMVPRRVPNIAARTSGDWSSEREELLLWADSVLGEK